jgi:integrase
MPRFSDATIRSLPTPERGQKLYTDETLIGFGVRVSGRGAKTFVLTVGTERQRITLGRYPIISLADARKKAAGILRDRELGITHKPSPPFVQVYEEYLATRDQTVRPNTRRAEVYMLRPFLVFSKQKIGEIQPAEIARILDAIKAPITRRHAFSNIRNLFRFAFKREYVNRNPLDRLDCPPENEPRDRVLTDTELRSVYQTAVVYGWPYGTIVRLCILLGQRRHQIAALKVQYIDFDAKTITWPPDQMKTKKRHTIPFGLTTERILRETMHNADGLYFPSRTGTPFAGWSNHTKRFEADCGFYDWVLHDLRRTLATGWQEMGIEIATTEKYLSHSAITGGLVGIYQKATYLEPMRNAVLRWEAKLEALLSNTESMTNGPELPGLRYERARAAE